MKKSRTYIAIIVSITIVMFAVLLVIAVVLYKRRRLSKRFHIFHYPPSLDYIERIDDEKLLVEQTNKLPYLSEWEFPRERVFIGKSTLFNLIYFSTIFIAV